MWWSSYLLNITYVFFWDSDQVEFVGDWCLTIVCARGALLGCWVFRGTVIYGMHHKSEASASMHLGWPQSSINFTTCGVHNALCVGALSLLLHLFYIHFPHLVIVASTLFFKTPPFYSSYFFSVFCFLFFVIIAALCCYILNNNCEAAVHSSNLGSITVTT